MRISVTEAKGLLTELICRAEAGDEVVLTRHGKPAVRLVPIMPVAGPEARRALLKSVCGEAACHDPHAACRNAFSLGAQYHQSQLPGVIRKKSPRALNFSFVRLTGEER